jgi:hypothetical protein
MPHLFSPILFDKAVSSGSSAQARTRRTITNAPTLLTSSNRASDRTRRGVETFLNEERRSVLDDFQCIWIHSTPRLCPEPVKRRARQTNGIPFFGFNDDRRPSIQRLHLSRHCFIQDRLCVMLQLLAQCLFLLKDTMRRTTVVPISPTRIKQRSAPERQPRISPHHLEVLLTYRIASLPEPDAANSQPHHPRICVGSLSNVFPLGGEA